MFTIKLRNAIGKALYVTLNNVNALVMRLFTFTGTRFRFRTTVFRVRQGQRGNVSLRLTLLVRPPSLAFIYRRTPSTRQVLVRRISIIMKASVRSLCRRFAVLGVSPTIFRISPSNARTLSLHAFRFGTNFRHFRGRMFVTHFAIYNGNFYYQALLDKYRSTHLLSPL